MINYPISVCFPHEIEPEDLPSMGWIRITSIGEENMYFTDIDGNECFCKIEGYDYA